MIGPKPIQTISAAAAARISSNPAGNRYPGGTFVTLAVTSGLPVVTAAGDGAAAAGVVRGNYASGEQCDVILLVPGTFVPVTVDVGPIFPAGNWVASSANGLAIEATTGDYKLGIACQDGAAGKVIDLFVPFTQATV